MFKQKVTYELPLKRDYVSHWGLMEAIRELFQNAIDGGEWRWHLVEEGELFNLHIISDNIRLPAATLVLGETSKREDSQKIGAFGEGFKLALLVLARLGVQIEMLNDNLSWTPIFIHSKTFDTEVFAIEEEKAVYHDGKGLEYQIKGLTKQQCESLKSCFIFMRTLEVNTEAFWKVEQGTIFTEEQSAIYVGGLFICSTKLDYSYDLKPGIVALERDRQTVADFELQWLTKDMWIATKQWEKIANMIERESKDVEYIHYNCPELLKDAVYAQFLKNNPGGIMAHSMEQMQELVKKGMEKVVYVGGAYGSIVCTAQPPQIAKQLERKSPEEELRSFLSNNRQYMRTPAIVAMKDLIDVSKTWKGSR